MRQDRLHLASSGGVKAAAAARAVVIKLSSWSDAQNISCLLDTLRSCAAVAAYLSAGRVEEAAP
jgi:hypothetical protein